MSQWDGLRSSPDVLRGGGIAHPNVGRDIRKVLGRAGSEAKLHRSNCQSAFKFDPFGRRVLAVALVPSELAGIEETVRARAA
jgi:hypothetical protein